MQRFTVAVLASVCFAITAPASAQTLCGNGPFTYLRNLCTGGSAANMTTPETAQHSKSSNSAKNNNKNNHNGDKHQNGATPS